MFHIWHGKTRSALTPLSEVPVRSVAYIWNVFIFLYRCDFLKMTSLLMYFPPMHVSLKTGQGRKFCFCFCHKDTHCVGAREWQGVTRVLVYVGPGSHSRHFLHCKNFLKKAGRESSKGLMYINLITHKHKYIINPSLLFYSLLSLKDPYMMLDGRIWPFIPIQVW